MYTLRVTAKFDRSVAAGEPEELREPGTTRTKGLREPEELQGPREPSELEELREPGEPEEPRELGELEENACL